MLSLTFHIYLIYKAMRREGGVRYLLDKLQKISSQNAQLKQSIRQRQNFNRKLCSQNRKRRLKNNDLMHKENQRLLELQSLKGHEEQLRRMAQNLRRALQENQQKLQSYEDQILILKSELTKQKAEMSHFQDENSQLRRKNDKKDEQIERLNSLQAQITKKRITPGNDRAPDYEMQVIQLVCQNQELEMKLKDAVKAIAQHKRRADMAEDQVKALQDELQTNKQIIAILKEQYEQEIKDMSNNATKGGSSSSVGPKPIPMSIITKKEPVANSMLFTKQPPASTQRPHQKVSLQKYGTRLTISQGKYFSTFQQLLYSPTTLQNLSYNPITIHHCQPVNLYGNHTWFTRIRLAAQGEVQFGVASSPYGASEVMSNRNYVYYSNCAGLIVIDKNGKVIDEYASINDTLTLTINCVQATTMVRYYKNEKMIYQIKVSEQLGKNQCLYPFIRLFDFMAIELE